MGIAMSKGLEALEELRKQSETHGWLEQQFEKEWLNVIEKELKALKIIKEKNVDIRGIKLGVTVGVYNALWAKKDEWHLTQEEFDLLKEVLG